MGGGKSAPAPPTLKAPRQVPLAETFSMFMGQGAELPALSEFASRINETFRSELDRGLPGTIAATRQTKGLVDQLLSGVPSADVQAQVQRQLAERSLAAGLPGTSEAARFGEAASYGLTSMQLQQQGMAAMPGVLQMAEYLSPQQAQNYLFSTGQLRGEQLKAAQDAANVANQNAMNKYNYDVQQSQSSGGGLGGTIGGILGAVGGSFLMPGVGTALGGMLGSGLGSLAGGGGFQLGAGQAGGAIGPMGQMASSLFGGGLLGGGGGLAGVSGMNLGGGSSAAGISYPGPSMSMPTSMVSSFLTPSSMGGYGGMGSTGSRMF